MFDTKWVVKSTNVLCVTNVIPKPVFKPKSGQFCDVLDFILIMVLTQQKTSADTVGINAFKNTIFIKLNQSKIYTVIQLKYMKVRRLRVTAVETLVLCNATLFLRYRILTLYSLQRYFFRTSEQSNAFYFFRSIHNTVTNFCNIITTYALSLCSEKKDLFLAYRQPIAGKL